MVSVIIPVYNAEATLGDAVESARNQTFHGWELILVNDGSSDSTASICYSFADSDCRIRVVQGGGNSGAYSARLKGVECAKNEWILFLDADDILLQDALKALLAFDNGKRSIIVGNIVLDNKIVRQNNPSGDLTSRCYLNAILSRSVYIEVCVKEYFSSIFALDCPAFEIMLVLLLTSAKHMLLVMSTEDLMIM